MSDDTQKLTEREEAALRYLVKHYPERNAVGSVSIAIGGRGRETLQALDLKGLASSGGSYSCYDSTAAGRLLIEAMDANKPKSNGEVESCDKCDGVVALAGDGTKRVFMHRTGCAALLDWIRGSQRHDPHRPADPPTTLGEGKSSRGIGSTNDERHSAYLGFDEWWERNGMAGPVGAHESAFRAGAEWQKESSDAQPTDREVRAARLLGRVTAFLERIRTIDSENDEEHQALAKAVKAWTEPEEDWDAMIESAG